MKKLLFLALILGVGIWLGLRYSKKRTENPNDPPAKPVGTPTVDYK